MATTVNSLQGKVAVITGASRGIGRAIAHRLAAEGVKIALCARTKADLEKVCQEVHALDTPCLAYDLDMSREGQVKEFLDKVEAQWGPIQILINNAGLYKTQPVEAHPLPLWQDLLNTNLTATLLTCRQVVAGMKAQCWGRIVNISSISGKVAEAFGAAYSASKFGVIGLTQSLAQEVAKHGITVNAVCPGWVDTKMASDQLADETYLSLTGQGGCQAKEIARLSMPQLRFIEPEEVADLVHYLCTHSARGITGQAINICGGQSLH